jgi:DNA-directed RNA polymerase specialized sigma24 family protein
MQDLIQKISDSAKEMKGDSESVSALYDKYAPALYGRIIQVVKQKEIAEKVLERVFINALVDKNVKQPDHLTLFTSLLNHSRKKSYGTLKALRMFEACSCS